MKDYPFRYSETSRKQIRKLHPQIKAVVKSKIERLQENPYTGKLLEKELSGYLSIRMKPFRIIYKISDDDRIDEQPRRKQRGIKRKILNAPRGGELNPRPPQAD